MHPDFDRYSYDYRGHVKRSIGFLGHDHDFFVRHKVGHLLRLTRRWVGLPEDLTILDVGCGLGQFTRRIGMLVNKEHLGFGYRSWRYSMVVNDGVIEEWFEEPGINDQGSDDDPYLITDPDTMIAALKAKLQMSKRA